MRKEIKAALWGLALSIPHVTLAQLVIDGAAVTIQSGAEIYINDDLINQGNGSIANEGLLVVTGDWLNNGVPTMLTSNAGSVELAGNDQIIGGDATTTFNDLSFTGAGVKTLEASTFIGMNGSLDLLDADLHLTTDTLTILNPDVNALARTTGMIISETTLDESPVHWNVGTSIGNYVIPFGTMADVYIPLTWEVTTAGMGNGMLSASTYPTADDNQPLPAGVTNIEVNGTDAALRVVDRFWNVTTQGYTNEPVSNLTFSFDPMDDTKPNNTIDVDSLTVISWNDSNMDWQVLESDASNGNAEVSTNGVSAYGWMSLYSMDRTTSVDDLETVFSEVSGFYPNPANELAQLNFVAKKGGVLQAKVYDARGQLVLENSQSLQSGANTLHFDLIELSTGVYQVVLESGTAIYTSKLVVNRP